jgi:precorrin-2 dehydrogenase/sirohydrochlorin ferrochelatase
MPPVYPVSLLLDGCPCLVVGGGRIATRKATDLLACGAHVTVVSPEFHDAIHRLEGLDLIQRPFEDDDVAGQTLVFAATSDPGVNHRVARAARRARVWVNVVDTPEECDFYVPASVRRGDLAISISTSGAVPALSRSLRRQLEAIFPEEYAQFVALLGELREEIIQQVDDPKHKKDILTRLADEATWRRFQSDGAETIRALAHTLIEEQR